MKTYEIALPHHGRVTQGVLYAPERESFPVVIMCHGLNGKMSDFQLTASHFAENDVGALCIGFSGGGLCDQSGFPTTSMTLFSEKEDLLSILNHLKSAPYTEKIFLFGGSQGGMVAAMVAEERREDIQGMILIYPAFCIAEHGRERFPRPEDIPQTIELFGMSLGRDYFLSLREFQTFREIGTFHRPVLILHGDRDDIVPLACSQRAAALYPNASLVVLPNERHGFTADGNHKTEELSLRFIKHILDG